MSESTLIQSVSAAILLAPILGALAWVWLGARRRGWPLGQYFLIGYGYFMARLLWRAKVEGQVELPPGQGAVIICNHRGPFDPAFIQLAGDRVVHWMVAREYCRHPAIAWFFRWLQCIPVGRGGIDTAATKMAIRYARQGDLVGMLPEGRINQTDTLLLPGRPGAAMVALKAQVPVIPCYVTGSPLGSTLPGSLLVPARTHLKVGLPIDLSEYYGRDKDREVLREVTLRLLKEIAHLAGHDDFEPQLAGRQWT